MQDSLSTEHQRQFKEIAFCSKKASRKKRQMRLSGEVYLLCVEQREGDDARTFLISRVFPFFLQTISTEVSKLVVCIKSFLSALLTWIFLLIEFHTSYQF